VRIEGRSPAEIADRYVDLGWPALRSIQLESGALQITSEVGFSGRLGAITATSSQKILTQGRQVEGFTAFHLLETGEAIDLGVPSDGACLTGYFSGGMVDFITLGTFSGLFVQTARLQAHIEKAGAFKAADAIGSTGSISLNAADRETFLRFNRRIRAGEEVPEAQVLNFLTLTACEQGVDRDFDPTNQDLMRELVELLHSRAQGEPLDVVDMASMLNSSRSTLSARCTEAFGMGPKALFQRIRLEQCRHALILEGGSIEKVARRYGFLNRGRFIRYYGEAFGEKPTETVGQLRLKLKRS